MQVKEVKARITCKAHKAQLQLQAINRHLPIYYKRSCVFASVYIYIGFDTDQLRQAHQFYKELYYFTLSLHMTTPYIRHPHRY